MKSTMQTVPLRIERILTHGSTFHGRSLVVTATGSGARFTSFAEIGRNAARLANALTSLGVGTGDRVATFQWNNQEHVEAYFAVPCMGAVLHPLNIRLFPEQVVYVANHAEDRVVIVDHTLVEAFAKLLPDLTTVKHVIVTGPADISLLEGVGVHRYDDLLAAQPETYDWPDIDEDAAAAMCYTSGTTGNPKGVVYSHRSIFLHSLGIALPGSVGLGPADTVLAIVPQFHVLAWGLPYAAFLTGASLAMPDQFLAPAPLAAFIAAAAPNKGAGVPTVWQGLLHYLQQHPEADIAPLSEAIVGGSTCPPSLMRDFAERGVEMLHVWGMTEMSPLGTVSRPPAGAEDPWRYRHTQGRFVGAVEPRLVGPDGETLPHDGESVGELEVRGPWVTAAYYRDDDPAKFRDGWLRTGDVGTITPDGFLTITDRAKDVIKSGGEWISSVELETHLMAHPGVVEAAVVGVPDDRWGERPLATVVVWEDEHITPAELRDFLAAKLARWQLPERWAFVTEVPKTSVGKFDKKEVRRRYADGELDIVTAG